MTASDERTSDTATERRKEGRGRTLPRLDARRRLAAPPLSSPLLSSLSRAQKHKWNAVSQLVRDEEKDLGGMFVGPVKSRRGKGCRLQELTLSPAPPSAHPWYKLLTPNLGEVLAGIQIGRTYFHVTLVEELYSVLLLTQRKGQRDEFASNRSRKQRGEVGRPSPRSVLK